MKVSLQSPSIESMPRLLELSKQMHDHEALSFDVEHVTSSFSYLIGNPAHGDVFLIALDQDGEQEIIGYVVLCYSFSIELGGQIAVIDQIFLSKDWRRQGVGSHVLPSIEAQANSRNCHAVILEVNIGNSGAREFYEQFDYMPRRQHCIMAKRLPR
ncbi:GNAT family N-acetyltransferase [Enterovibrio paralichthyis]|uniref:GNAT family N-acetyltransferase n=1 Tax=Enterovibrio paralichthyis TaxID=2853805 RepID=UPI001C46C6FC|nr:GNAT family N-acetyltransferase [Enterovibrio paralichthyis]MBV7296900.1 GNAT family N-acetyltransferase [Enterovibrio paralichthyis]